jgi:hypothetical protein
MRVLRIMALAFLAGVILSACKSPTAPCLDRTIVTDTIGWVERRDGTLAPITTTGPACVRFRMAA